MGSKSTRRWIAIGAAGTLGLSFIAASAANAAADTALHVGSASQNGSQHSPSLIGNGTPHFTGNHPGFHPPGQFPGNGHAPGNSDNKLGVSPGSINNNNSRGVNHSANGPVIVHVHHNGNADVSSIGSAPVH